jgi:hypothetical protein
MTCKVGDFAFEGAWFNTPDLTTNMTQDNTLILYGTCYYLNLNAHVLMKSEIAKHYTKAKELFAEFIPDAKTAYDTSRNIPNGGYSMSAHVVGTASEELKSGDAVTVREFDDKIVKFTPQDKATQDQMAAIMLLTGSPEQKIEALERVGAHRLAAQIAKEVDEGNFIRIGVTNREVDLLGFIMRFLEAFQRLGARSTMKMVMEGDHLVVRFKADDTNIDGTT